MPQFYCVIGNRDHLKVKSGGGEVDKRPIFDFIEGQEHWLTSLVYLRNTPIPPGVRFFDCGAWSYKGAAEPKWTPAQCVERYAEYAGMGDFVAAPDHMVLKDHDDDEQRRRIALTLDNARAFLPLVDPSWVPVGVTHGHTVEERVRMTEELLTMGYRAIAIGSVAVRAGNRKFITALLDATTRLREQEAFHLHVLGVSALSWYPVFRDYGVDSFDGSAMFFAAFTAGEYFWLSDNGRLIAYAVKHTDLEAIPLCTCPACSAMRAQGDDPRQYGSNERNMGRAVHNINVYRRALELVRDAPMVRQPTLW